MTAVVVILGTCAVALAALVAAVVLVTLRSAGRTEYVEPPSNVRVLYPLSHPDDPVRPGDPGTGTEYAEASDRKRFARGRDGGAA